MEASLSLVKPESVHIKKSDFTTKDHVAQRHVTWVEPRSIPIQSPQPKSIPAITLKSQPAAKAQSTQPPDKLKLDVTSAPVVLGNLVSLGVVDVSKYGSSAKERSAFMTKNVEMVKADFLKALQDNVKNPLLHHVMKKAGLDISGIQKLIGEMSADTIQRFNLSNIKVVDQLPFHIRAIYPELENPTEFLRDMDWMHSQSQVTEKTFQKELALVEAGNEQRLLALHSSSEPYFECLCIGRGSGMTKYWEFMPKTGRKASTIFVGKDTGLWKQTYQLGQKSGILEYAPDTAASNYNPDIDESFHDSQVDAHHLYKSIIHSQYAHDFPGIAGEVIKVERDRKGNYRVHISYEISGKKQVKKLLVKKIIVGTGLSDSRDIFYQKGHFFKEDFAPIVGEKSTDLFKLLAEHGYFQASGKSLNKKLQLTELQLALKGEYTDDQINSIAKLINEINAGRAISKYLSKEDCERLAAFDSEKGFTPLIDGTTFILTNSDCTERGKGRKILVWGGGGTAAASARKGLFNKDSPRVKPTPESYKSRVNEVLWVTKNGFDTSGVGSLVVDAITTLTDADKLWESCEITGIEPIKGNRLRVYIDKYQIVDDPKKYPSTALERRNIQGKIYACIKTKEVVEVDQLIHNLGQDNRNIEQLFGDFELGKNAEIAIDSDLGVPLYGTLKTDKNIQFHGASFTTYPFSATSMPMLNQTVSTENMPRDVGPGAMAMAWSSMRATHFSGYGVFYKSVNASLDYARFIDRHLSHWGVFDKTVRENFLRELVAKRSETRGGITNRTLNQLIRKYNLQGKIFVDSTCMLCPSTPIRSAL